MPVAGEPAFDVNVLRKIHMTREQKADQMREAINRKLVFSQDEVCRLLKITPETLRDWEKEFSLFFAGETASGKRIYRQKDVLIVLRIKELLEEKNLTRAGIKRKIEEEFGFKTDRVPPEMLFTTLARVKEELQEILRALEKKPEKS